MHPKTILPVPFRHAAAIAVLITGLFTSLATPAANKYWIGGNGAWEDGTNWSPAGQPQTGDYVNLTQSDSTNRTVYYSSTSSLTYLTINATGTGTITLNSDGGNLSVVSEYIGYDGTGSFIQNGGTHRVGSGVLYTDLTLGYQSSGIGSYSLINGSLAARDEYLGYYGNGSFNQSGGTNTVNGVLFLGYGAGSSGTYNLSGTGSLTALAVNIGVGGTGNFTQNGGTNNITNRLLLGWGASANSSGTYNLNAGSLTVATETIGYNTSGTFTQNGGSNTVSNMLYLSDGYGDGTYNLNAGTLTVGGNVTKSSYSTGIGTLSISGGTLTIGGGNGDIYVDNFVIGSISGSNVNYTFSDTGLYEGSHKIAGTLTANNLFLGKDGTGTFTQTGGNNTISGTVTLAANAGSAGTYNLNDGALRATTITVNSGGTFNFNGGTLSVDQFNGDLANLGGTLAPGNSPGITNITGNYSQSGAGIFDVEIGGTSLGQFDMLNISGTATLDGTLNVSLFDWGSGLFTPQVGDSFDILAAQILSGQFSTYNLAALGDGLAWNISYLTDAIDTTDIVRLSVISAVPVPPAIWLFGSGLLGLVGIARKRKFH